ncbi:sulfatase-like hydrolase/transferase [Sedimenticola thiotaurini]|uniref:Sulfatase n=1 Tax=Sedimenticola thiotaurini TaxID=1543721 RepID=A0A0F7JY38_9GAMM|nr:sulfatase-like hydrolase/transferase [Sedimenticola thiotaurini]AKH19790.1 sulfatase [Sedimenticola thiotaurini]
MKHENQNLVIIMSDEHNPKYLGCYGHELVSTPHLDALAASGTVFENAYTPSPVCVPARAAFATGRPVHQIGYWDNATPYDGREVSWHHTLRQQGHQVVSIGKLHFSGEGRDHGFSEEQIPLHVLDGKGDLMGLVRDDLPVRGNAWKMARLAGPGESSYTLYDREIAARAQIWLQEAANRDHAKPWCLFVSFVAPHFPLTAPPEYYYRYYNDPDLPMPKQYGQIPSHPFHQDYARSFCYDDHFEDADNVRRAIAGYFGLCTFLDEQVGKVLGALDRTGLSDSTRVLYLSDHGDSLGARGLWGKSNMYEEAVSVPLIAKGPYIPAGRRLSAPCSLLDVHPFILETVGAEGDDTVRPGISLTQQWQQPDCNRVIISEYHGMGSRTAAYMVRRREWKYIHYADPAYPPELFNLVLDPEELIDLAAEPDCQTVRAELLAELEQQLDPVETDRRAKAFQEALLNQHGGREVVIARGDLGFSPTPGSGADLR